MNRIDLENQEDIILAPYALKNKYSKGRAKDETPDIYRLDFARDRDRIIHTKAFRRLKGKTQVFVSYFHDHYRSRLTHTLEVAQIARTLARIFKANEDICEAVALAHDLGHTPFGHAGQDILNAKLKPFGEQFEHNEQSRRILEELEPQNLCAETLQCLCKHPSKEDTKQYLLEKQNYLEGQIVDIADAIAYCAADLQDGLSAGILKKQQWNWLPENPIDAMVQDIALFCVPIAHQFPTPDSIRQAKEPIIRFSQKFLPTFQKMKIQLLTQMYRNPIVIAQTEKGTQILSDIFDALMENASLMPEDFRSHDPYMVRIKDFIASMTDAFAEDFWNNISKK